MVRSKSLAAVALVLGAFIASCSREPLDLNSAKSSPLVNGIESLSSPKDLQSRPDMARLHWSEIEGSRSSPSDARFSEYVAVVDGYSVDGFPGALRLDFVNEHLISTWFYPDDFNGFVAHLQHEGIRIDSKNRSEDWHVPGTATVIRIGLDHQTKNYVSWEDEQVSSLVDRWITKNS